MSSPLKWIFDAKKLPPGDLLMLTAALREIHFWYPNKYLTDVRTDFPAIWENNPYLTPLSEDDPKSHTIRFDYSIADQSNQSPRHFIEAFPEYLNHKYQLQLKLTQFKGEIFLSPEEQAAPSPIQQLIGIDLPYWIIVSGGKYDSTVKWWDHSRIQKVIDHFQKEILFVQVGQSGFHHPPLRGVIDFRGKTTLRSLMQLMHHSSGVVCPITFLMHLAAAVPTFDNHPRPCVTVAGGREPPHWFSYPTHQVVHTVGTLPCCQDGGCWKSRVLPLHDGRKDDHPSLLCQNVVDDRLPKCMDLITPRRVADAINYYLQGTKSPTLSLTESQKLTVKKFLSQGQIFPDPGHA